MSQKILTLSYIKLRLINSTIESKYEKHLFERGKKVNLIAISINTLLISLILILTLVKIDRNQRHFICLLILTLTQIGFIIIILILMLTCSSKAFIYNLSGSVNYFINAMFFIIFKRILRYLYLIDDQGNSYIYYFDFAAKIIWAYFKIADNHYFCIANIFVIVLSKPISIYIDDWPSKEILPAFLGDLFSIFTIILNYWHNVDARYIFYYLNELNEQNEWFKKVINTMNSGLIKVTNGNISYINQSLIEVGQQLHIINEEPPNLENNIDNRNNNNNSNRNRSYPSSRHLLSFILKKVDFISNTTEDSKCETNRDECSITIFKGIFDKIKSVINSLNTKEKEKSIYLGRGNISEYSLNIDFELYVRYYNNLDEENFEFIFNNVTRTKLNEEKNTELRVKSIVLSKIAHEFKNPLICLSEIIEEEYNKYKECQNVFTQIKAISNYLLILIKNIDYFAQMQCDITKSPISVDITKTPIDEILLFIQLIALYLIKKKNIGNSIQFNIVNRCKQKYIESDDVKIKQLLLNLISNAIKFTHQGAVTLTISNKEKDYIRFKIKDTGTGIPIEYQKGLFLACDKFKHTENNNFYGTGLGLSISKEISFLLGKGIEFKSTEGKGSKFWFSVYSPTNEIHSTSENSIATTIKIDYALTLFKNRNMSMAMTMTKPKNAIESIQIVRNYTIILADDEEIIRNSIKKTIIKYSENHAISIQIIEATDGIEVLWLYYSTISRNEKIDMILSDENMAYYSGHKAAFEINEISNKVGVKKPTFYILSSYCLNESNSYLYVDGYLQKPLDCKDLLLLFQ